MTSNLLGSFVHYSLAQVWAFVKRIDNAIAHYRRSVELDPDFQRAWRALGFLLASENDTVGAIAALRRAVALEPDDWPSRFNLGFLHHQRGEHDAAIEQFTAVTAGSPNLDRAWYGLGLIYLERGELEPAIANLERASKLQYFNPHAAHHLILAYARAGRHDAGRKELKRLEGYDPKAAKQAADELARLFTSH